MPKASTIPSQYPRGTDVKNCKLCRFSKVCNDLPGICIVIPYVAITIVVVAIGYLFVTQEILS